MAALPATNGGRRRSFCREVPVTRAGSLARIDDAIADPNGPIPMPGGRLLSVCSEPATGQRCTHASTRPRARRPRPVPATNVATTVARRSQTPGTYAALGVQSRGASR